MKKLIFIICSFLIVFSSCKKDDPSPAKESVRDTVAVFQFGGVNSESGTISAILIDTNGVVLKTWTKSFNYTGGTHDAWTDPVYETITLSGIPNSGKYKFKLETYTNSSSSVSAVNPLVFEQTENLTIPLTGFFYCKNVISVKNF